MHVSLTNIIFINIQTLSINVMLTYIPVFTKKCLWCRIKIFGGGAGVVTPSTTSLSFPPTNNFCLYLPPVLRCFGTDPLMTPHHPTSSILHCYPLPIHHPCPYPPLLPPLTHKNFDHTPGTFFISLCRVPGSSFTKFRKFQSFLLKSLV